GRMDQLRAYSQHMATEGVAGVRINYRRLSEGTPFVTAKQDVEDAIDFIRKHADEFHFDLTRLGMAGASAGAVLTSLVAQETPECSCYIAFNGGFDLVNRGNSTFPGAKEMKTMFGAVSEDKLCAASSIYHIKNDPPDTLLLHGTADSVIDCDQAKRFAAAILAKGGMAKVVLYEGEEHGFFNANRRCFPEILTEVEKHMERVFKLDN
ncbi:MAG: alpha/beta hydrolase family protein, partial [Kiritimatiellales bacterium]